MDNSARCETSEEYSSQACFQQPLLRRLSANHPLSCGSLCERLANLVSPRLLREHHAETLKVVQRPPLRDRLPLLRPRRLLPLLHRALLLQLLADHTAAGTAGEGCENEWRQGKMTVGEGLARNTSRRAVDDSLPEQEDTLSLTNVQIFIKDDMRTRLWSMISAITAI